jgi:rubrerythrin
VSTDGAQVKEKEMKTKGILTLALVATAFFVLGRSTKGTATQLNQKTLDNLSTAMHGEAFAHAKYLLYAQHARHSGNADLAALFQRTASVERLQHFAEEAQLAGLVGSDADNLKDAIKGESYEVETMYADFARQATAAGDKAAADRFEEVRKDEMAHRDAFQAALKTLESKAAGN